MGKWKSQFEQPQTVDYRRRVLDIRELQSIFPSCGNKDLIILGDFSQSCDHSYRLTSHLNFFPKRSGVWRGTLQEVLPFYLEQFVPDICTVTKPNQTRTLPPEVTLCRDQLNKQVKVQYGERMRNETQEFREKRGSGDQHCSKVKVLKLNPSQLYYTFSHE